MSGIAAVAATAAVAGCVYGGYWRLKVQRQIVSADVHPEGRMSGEALLLPHQLPPDQQSPSLSPATVMPHVDSPTSSILIQVAHAAVTPSSRQYSPMRHYAQQIVAPDAGQVNYFATGWTPRLQGIEEFCAQHFFVSTDEDHPETLGKSLDELWVTKKSTLRSGGMIPRISWNHARTLHSYTVESQLYKVLTAAMRRGNETELHSDEFSDFRDYIYFLHKALESGIALHAYNVTTSQPLLFLYRGIKVQVDSTSYAPGCVVTW